MLYSKGHENGMNNRSVCMYLLTQSSKILGAQGNLWTEFIKTPEQVEYMTVPRMTALSEVVWSKRKVRNFKEFRFYNLFGTALPLCFE